MYAILEKYKQLFLLLAFLCCSTINYAQQDTSFWTKSDTLNKKRRNAVYITEVAAAAITIVGMNQLWYADYPRTSFQFKNDNEDWLQMDKFGHVLSTYHVGRLGMETLEWAGESKKNKLLFGATLGMAFLTSIEVLDGFSEEWGFSTGDMIANASGAGLLIGQELLWNEQRFTLKYSFHQTSFAKLRPDVLGKNFLEQAIKDYNGITYWLSGNIWSFNKESKFPKWLNLAFGYGADGLLYGSENQEIEDLGLPQTERTRQFYLSLDIDLTKIKTRSKFLKTLFSAINFIKIPAPTLEFNSNKGVKFHILYF